MNQNDVSNITASMRRGGKTESLKKYAQYLAYQYDMERRKAFLDKTFDMLKIPSRFR